MSDYVEHWLLHSVHEKFRNGPPGEVFAEYERLRASAQLSENRLEVYEECVKKLASAEAALREAAKVNEAALDDRIAAYTKLAEAEARLLFVPSPEQWAEVQSQLRSANERLVVALNERDMYYRKWNTLDIEQQALRDKLKVAEAKLAAAVEAELDRCHQLVQYQHELGEAQQRLAAALVKVGRLEEQERAADACETRCNNERDWREELQAKLAGAEAALESLRGSDVHYLRGCVNVLADKLAGYTGKTAPTEITGAESVLVRLAAAEARCEMKDQVINGQHTAICNLEQQLADADLVQLLETLPVRFQEATPMQPRKLED